MTARCIGFSREERRLLQALRTPFDIQAFVDTVAYEPAPGARSPRVVMRTRRGHCFSGALFAAAALWRLGHPPLLVDLRAVRDDDHVLAVYRVDGRWGAVGQSNFTTLRARDPVYRSLRELVMSYFDFYFNVLGEKSLREYSRPLDLRRFGGNAWMFAEPPLDDVEEQLERLHHYPLVEASRLKRLSPASPIVLQAGLLGSDPAGLFDPDKAKP